MDKRNFLFWLPDLVLQFKAAQNTSKLLKLHFLKYLNGISSVSVCIHCPLSCHWIPLKIAWLCLLYRLPSSIWTPWQDPPLSTFFSRLDSHSSFSLSSYGRYSSPLIILGGPSLDSLQVHPSLSCKGGPRPGYISGLWAYQCWAEGKDHLTRAAGNIPPQAGVNNWEWPHSGISAVTLFFALLLLGTWTPPPPGHCSQGCLPLSHPSQHILVCKYQVQQSTSPCCVWSFGQKLVVSALQEPHRLLTIFCVVPQADIRHG